MKDSEVWDAIEALASYVVDRIPDGWEHIAIEIGFVADDVIEISGEYTDETDAAVALAFGPDIAAIAESIRQALDQPSRTQIEGLHLSIEADGALSGEFMYADGE